METNKETSLIIAVFNLYVYVDVILVHVDYANTYILYKHICLFSSFKYIHGMYILNDSRLLVNEWLPHNKYRPKRLLTNCI